MSSTPPSSSRGEAVAGRWSTFLLVAYAAVSLAFILPSARLWLQHPMTLTAFEFDYFLGAFWPRNLELLLAIIQAGRLVHLVGFLIVGGLFAVIVRRLLQHPAAVPLSLISWFAALLGLVWSLGLPWVSPDVFFYIGSGWLDGHYGLSPYWHAISEVPGFQHDPMFRNVLPYFLGGVTGYGPVFQIAARGLALASGGSETTALILYKIVNLALHAGASVLVLRLVSPERRSAVLFFYACNPLILFSILTCAHNDHAMNVLVLAAFLFREQGRPAFSGLALAGAVSIKYIPLLLVPLFALDLLFSPGPSAKRDRVLAMARLTAAFVLSAALMHLAYPDAVRRFYHTAMGGIGGARESLHFMLPWVSLLFPTATMPSRGVLIALFAALYGACLLAFARHARREGRFRLPEAVVAVLLVYFLVLNQTNQEWYLTWVLGPLALIGLASAMTFGIRLSWLFLPLVIFTVRNSVLVNVVSNSLLYLLLVGLSVPLVLELVRRAAPRSRLLSGNGPADVATSSAMVTPGSDASRAHSKASPDDEEGDEGARGHRPNAGDEVRERRPPEVGPDHEYQPTD